MHKIMISIITATYNSAETINDTIKSVLCQTNKDFEYIIVDGGSTDETIDIVKSCESEFSGRLKWVSEKDKGIYDAMNKGIKMASGDIIGILNSDDFYTDEDVLQTVADNFLNHSVDAIYGDIHFVHEGNLGKCVRYYSSKMFSPFWLRFGFMPAHPSFYCKREVFDKSGLYRLDYKIGSDYTRFRADMSLRISLRCGQVEPATAISIVVSLSSRRMSGLAETMVSIPMNCLSV